MNGKLEKGQIWQNHITSKTNANMAKQYNITFKTKANIAKKTTTLLSPPWQSLCSQAIVSAPCVLPVAENRDSSVIFVPNLEIYDQI